MFPICGGRSFSPEENTNWERYSLQQDPCGESVELGLNGRGFAARKFECVEQPNGEIHKGQKDPYITLFVIRNLYEQYSDSLWGLIPVQNYI